MHRVVAVRVLRWGWASDPYPCRRNELCMVTETHDVENSGAAAVTRSAEELRVTKVPVESQRVRLRKHVVSETATQTVTVRREELAVERLPADDRADPDPDPDPEGAFVDEDFEIVLYEERVVTRIEVVPREIVRVSKSVVVDDVPVSAELAHEVVGVERRDGPDDRPFPIADFGEPPASPGLDRNEAGHASKNSSG